MAAIAPGDPPAYQMMVFLTGPVPSWQQTQPGPPPSLLAAQPSTEQLLLSSFCRLRGLVL